MTKLGNILFIIISLSFANLAMAEETIPKVRFATYELRIDTGEKALGAWQVELIYNKKEVAIVGIEGSKAFPAAQTPFYDPKGLSLGRIKIANFLAKAKRAPKGDFRLAILHLQITGESKPEFEIKKMLAGNLDGEKMKSKFSIKEIKKKELGK